MDSHELDAFFPAEMTVEVQGERFTLTAFKARNMRPYLAINRRLQDKATRLGVELATAQRLLAEYNEAVKASPATPFPDLGDIPAYVVAGPLDPEKLPVELLHERCVEEYIELVQIATGKPLEWVDELGIDDLVALAGIVNELNARRYTPKKATALSEQTAGHQPS